MTEQQLLSPTLSTVSLWKQQSPSEIIPLLKAAHALLKDKEKKIKVAAMHCKTLLENNIALSNQLYDSSMNLVRLDHQDSNVEYNEPSSTQDAGIEILQQQNSELSNQLDSLLHKQEELDRSHMLKSRQLELQIQDLQEYVNSATARIHEMQQAKNNTYKKTLTKDGTCCMKTRLELEQLKIGFDHVSQLKTQKERTLDEAQNQVSELTERCEAIRREYDELNGMYQETTQREEELRVSVQEYEDMIREYGTSEREWTEQVQQDNLHVELKRASSVWKEQIMHPISQRDEELEKEEEDTEEEHEIVSAPKGVSVLDFVRQWICFTVCMVVTILKTLLMGPKNTDIQ